MRSIISELVEDISPFDEKEKADQKSTLEWLNSGAEIFRITKPDHPKKHLVSYFLPYDEQKRKVLLVHHKKANLWLPPGGHVDPEEHPKDAAAREMEEELFCKAEFLQESPFFLTVTKTQNEDSSHTDVTFWYLVKGDANQTYQYDEREFYDLRWFDLNQLNSNQLDPHFFRFTAKLNENNKLKI